MDSKCECSVSIFHSFVMINPISNSSWTKSLVLEISPQSVLVKIASFRFLDSVICINFIFISIKLADKNDIYQSMILSEQRLKMDQQQALIFISSWKWTKFMNENYKHKSQKFLSYSIIFKN